MVMIFANTMYLGIAADFQVKNSFRRVAGLQKEPEWRIMDYAFAVPSLLCPRCVRLFERVATVHVCL